ncbi:hypothetical protein K8R32_03135 [bacterium]|nr:hypothetical protein [bacterium]
MSGIINYLQTAKDNETVFRNILLDLKNHRKNRSMGIYIPENLETKANIEEIFAKYSTGNRMGIFTICDFEIEGDTATITFADMAILSGGGATLKYQINKDKTVAYLKPTTIVMSLC